MGMLPIVIVTISTSGCQDLWNVNKYKYEATHPALYMKHLGAVCYVSCNSLSNEPLSIVVCECTDNSQR